MNKTSPPPSNLRRIKLLFLDVDGVLTDGGVYYSNTGDEMKRFSILDGYGIVKFHKAGLRTAIITGKLSNIVRRRAQDLGITEVRQSVENKLEAYREIRDKYALKDEECAYIGDEEFDIPVLSVVGFSAAPPNAMDCVKKNVRYICKQGGGNGAVREVIEMILRSRKNV